MAIRCRKCEKPAGNFINFQAQWKKDKEARIDQEIIYFSRGRAMMGTTESPCMWGQLEGFELLLF